MEDYPESVRSLAERIARLPAEDQSLLLSLQEILEACQQSCQEELGRTP